MSLILTHIDRYGIIHGSDSNVSTRSGRQAGQGRKTFPVQHLDAGLTVAGSYSVGNKRMDSWMDGFIQSHADSGNTSLANFAEALRNELQRQMLPDEKADGSMIHIAGYVEQGGESHPEFYFVTNVHRIDPVTGEYNDIDENFGVSEDFWNRDCPKFNLLQEFQRGVGQIYINGFASGRISFLALQRNMTHFFRGIWGNPTWNFRPPHSLDENRLLIEMYIRIIGTLFEISDYSAPFIGGDPRTYAIPQPPNIATAF